MSNSKGGSSGENGCLQLNRLFSRNNCLELEDRYEQWFPKALLLPLHHVGQVF